ncbi:MAG: amine oxidase, partial [Cyanobacteria bacterium P01_A01_bin.83]
VIRVKEGVTHFFPGSYQNLMSATTKIPNLYMSGDWIVTNHGSWSQEKAYVTGLEAANLVIKRFGVGNKANIIPIEADEPHIKIARTINQTIKDLTQFIPSPWLP